MRIITLGVAAMAAVMACSIGMAAWTASVKAEEPKSWDTEAVGPRWLPGGVSAYVTVLPRPGGGLVECVYMTKGNALEMDCHWSNP